MTTLHAPHSSRAARLVFGGAPSPEKTLARRRRVLKQAHEAEATFMAFHFPFPGRGRVRRTEKGYSFMALESNRIEV